MARGLATGFDGERLRTARSAVHLSLAALAARIGASKEEILLYESGRRRPEAPRIRTLAEALGVAPLDLADPKTKEQWTLADLRRLNGYRLQDLSKAVGLSVRSYGRVEREGLFPLQGYGLLAELADRLGVSAPEVEHAINQSPKVKERLAAAAPVLQSLIHCYTRRGHVGIPSTEDGEVKDLAALWNRPATTIAVIAGQEIDTLRALLRRRASLQATADFSSNANEQSEAIIGIQAHTERVQQVVSTLPQRMDSFFRCTLTAEHWRALSHLNSVAETLGVPLSAAQLTTSAKTLATIPGNLVDTFRAGSTEDVVQYAISEEGVKHQLQFGAWYDALYPRTRSHLQLRSVTSNGHLPLVELQRRFAEIDTVLLSFDGLLCRLFTTNRSSVTHELTHAANSLHLPLDSQSTTDPVGMLRASVRHGTSSTLRRLDHLLTSLEVEAARQAEPLPGVTQFLRIVSERDWAAAVVTDHAADAVETFLADLNFSITPHRLGVFGRPVDPRRMKPHPHLVSLATATLQANRTRTVLLGESVADFLAARAAGVEFIGVASSPRQLRLLRQAGVTGTVSSIQSLTRALTGL
ncbi:helix-turn-helix domain-containing protein [Streptomyces sp. NPDC091972]|uniref:helix-turn-helix domain-containing protein n=1 Tax=Streptomyces sp. NPDC091972 TaxID=3366007 RepID=UPI00382BC862